MSEALFCAPGPILPYPTSESFPAAPLGLDVASLSLAGSRPATGRSDQGLIPLLLRPDPRLAPVTAGTEILPSAGSDVPQMGRLSDVHMMIIGRASPRRPPAVPGLDPRGQPALTAHRARRTDPDPGPHLRLWEATSLAMECVHPSRYWSHCTVSSILSSLLSSLVHLWLITSTVHLLALLRRFCFFLFIRRLVCGGVSGRSGVFGTTTW